MSLIQDALKRKVDENGQIPALSPQMAGSGLEKNRPSLFTVILTVFIAAAITTVLIVLTFYPPGTHQLKRGPAEPESSPAVLRKDSVETEAPPVPVLQPPVIIVQAAIQEVPVQAVETSIVEVLAEPPLPDQEKPVPEVKLAWPELKLTGIAQSDGQSLAILNGKMLSAGRKLGEVIILEVHDQNIVVEYGGERRVLYIDD